MGAPPTPYGVCTCVGGVDSTSTGSPATPRELTSVTNRALGARLWAAR